MYKNIVVRFIVFRIINYYTDTYTNIYFLIKGQVNNLLQDNKSEIKSDVAESVKYTKPTQMSKPK